MIPRVRLVYDRKHLATKTTKGLVQIEIYHNGKRKWIGTNVSVTKDRWKNGAGVVNCHNCIELNNLINAQVRQIEGFIAELVEKGEEFTFQKLDSFLNADRIPDNFLDFLEDRIAKRNIAESTRVQHRTLLNSLHDYGKIQTFNDITLKNIADFDVYLTSKGLSQTTKANYHKRMKIYLNEAISLGKLKDYPYHRFKVDRGKSAKRRYLTEAELVKVENCIIDSPHVSRAKDMFLFQCYTGLSYSDMAKLKKSDIEERDGTLVIFDRRKKTNEDYFIALMPSAVEILEKYDYQLPIISNMKYNDYLKVVAAMAGVQPLTSHMGRHTFAVYALNKGVPIEVVSKILGHTDIKTTSIYAKIVGKSVLDAFKKIGR